MNLHPFAGAVDHVCACLQTSRMVLYWLQNRLAPLPFQPPVLPLHLRPVINSWQQPELKSHSHLPLFETSSLCFRANCFSSCKTQLKYPLLQETNHFLHWASIAHYHGSWCSHVSVPTSPRACRNVDSDAFKYNSTLNSQL